MDSADLAAIWLTLKLASVVTVLLLIAGAPIAWWLARTRSRLKRVIAAAVALPLVLPPTVLGFYLLLVMGPHGPVGKLTASLGLGLLPFTFPGLVIASVFYSFQLSPPPIARMDSVSCCNLWIGEITSVHRVLGKTDAIFRTKSIFGARFQP